MFFNGWLGIFMAAGLGFLSSLGIDGSKLRFREKLPQERAHYAKQLFDAEVWLDGYGWTELAGFACRTDYDLKGHMNKTGEDMSVTTADGRRVVPHVVEPSFGVERVLYAALEHNIREREGSFYLALPARIAPKDVSVFPLMDKPELARPAKDVLALLKRFRFLCNYDESGSIGRRYARSDEIGIPLAITIDYKTLEDNTVTIRDRDTREQERCAVNELPSMISAKLSGQSS
jgi:glycyl-tRNA synthetase